jgi:hypothetical protein
MYRVVITENGYAGVEASPEQFLDLFYDLQFGKEGREIEIGLREYTGEKGEETPPTASLGTLIYSEEGGVKGYRLIPTVNI